MTRNVLIIARDLRSKELLIELLKLNEFRPFAVLEAKSAIDLLRRKHFSLIFSDQEGIGSLERMSCRPNKVPLIYLKKEWKEKVQTSVAATLECPVKREKLETLLGQLLMIKGGERVAVIAKSAVMKQIFTRVKKIAQSHSNVFIIGESGTGKEVIASHIHAYSKRAAFPFIKVNCAALPDTLIESEFFGHEKGAFTGAHMKRAGRFERADQGTLLLDEISEISAGLQAKLLRVVQEQEFERLGGTAPIQVDVRLISTSNQNMREALRDHCFRKDLYYRLNVIPIFLPPLRERREDILPLANWFCEQICARNQLPCKLFSPLACEKLCQYDWPGNARELSNVVEHSIVMADSTEIKEIFFDPSTRLEEVKEIGKVTLKEVEKEHILAVFKRNEGHRERTARELDISVRTLRNKLKLYRDEELFERGKIEQ